MGKTEVTPAMARLIEGVPPREFSGHVLDLPRGGSQALNLPREGNHILDLPKGGARVVSVRN